MRLEPGVYHMEYTEDIATITIEIEGDKNE